MKKNVVVAAIVVLALVVVVVLLDQVDLVGAIKRMHGMA